MKQWVITNYEITQRDERLFFVTVLLISLLTDTCSHTENTYCMKYKCGFGFWSKKRPTSEGFTDLSQGLIGVNALHTLLSFYDSVNFMSHCLKSSQPFFTATLWAVSGFITWATPRGFHIYLLPLATRLLLQYRRRCITVSVGLPKHSIPILFIDLHSKSCFHGPLTSLLLP